MIKPSRAIFIYRDGWMIRQDMMLQKKFGPLNLVQKMKEWSTGLAGFEKAAGMTHLNLIQRKELLLFRSFATNLLAFEQSFPRQQKFNSLLQKLLTNGILWKATLLTQTSTNFTLCPVASSLRLSRCQILSIAVWNLVWTAKNISYFITGGNNNLSLNNT